MALHECLFRVFRVSFFLLVSTIVIDVFLEGHFYKNRNANNKAILFKIHSGKVSI